MNFHYIELGIVSSGDAAFERRLIGRCWHLLHSIASSHQLSYGIDFPDWEYAAFDGPLGGVKASGSFGGRIRIFSDASTLERFATELTENRLVASGCVELTSATKAPVVDKFVSFGRCRAMEKATPGFQLRQARRRERRLAAGKEPHVNSEQATKSAFEVLRERKPNFVTLSSNRSEDTTLHYRLSVERKASDRVSLPDNTFGLGGAVPSF